MCQGFIYKGGLRGRYNSLTNTEEIPKEHKAGLTLLKLLGRHRQEEHFKCNTNIHKPGSTSDTSSRQG